MLPIRGAWCFYFWSGGLGTISAPWDSGRPGRTRKGTRGVRNQSLIDLGLILGPCSGSFLGAEACIFCFFSALFPGRFLYRSLSRDLDTWGSSNQVFAQEVLSKPNFHRNRFSLISGKIFVFFSRPENGWSGFCFPGKMRENL